MAERIRRGSPTITTRQRARFIQHLAQTANVTSSCAFAGFDRPSAYFFRKSDPEFAEAWADALEQSIDVLEAEARRRALEGDKEPVVNKDGLVYDENGKPLYISKRSDMLLVTLLKAHRPGRFQPQQQAVAAGNAVPADLQPDPEPTPDEPGPANPIG
jgi:hypothetical protein